ncbi:Glycosyltransferase Family 8 protein [Trametes cinnabarina]|uniref:Glycosyltransferase Family 8 protein n=1 Tax=Pycnoporus cinnabarinus TaxID=5643 RepID=A0A060SP13_PYCCI|nr:Glycosyltransferase Family 8 protein [Trametes cinnabarina]
MSLPASEQQHYAFTETQDWFSFNTETWRKLFQHISTSAPRVLEIGSWEGRSAVFLLTELCKDGGEIVCIDHFDLMKTAGGRERHRKLTHNLAITGKPFRILGEFSVPALMTLLTEEMSREQPGFNWIYVDGSHEADDTFLDGELAWRLARNGAIIVFDDYHWDKEPEDSIHHPKRGIDAFLTLHRDEYTLLSSGRQYQVVLQKKVDMRIGFLVSEKADFKEELDQALGYGINVALTIDADYAIAAAVAIRSAALHTTGRITFYVVSRRGDLPREVEETLVRALPEGTNATVVFIELPGPDDCMIPCNSTWAKIAMLPHLPVERVLYLDADVLVRADLRELWDTDLHGKSIAAAVDIGYPLGHDGMERGPYFNAGVLLIDLAASRKRLDALTSLAANMSDSKLQDQDVLNAHFAGDWLPLSLSWNAQGLGTYATHHTPERAVLPLDEMTANPKIVHFTGSLHPSMAEVLNPFVQPYGGKPWSYAGAPGHPFKKEWWAVCEDTPWRAWRLSKEYRDICAQKIDEAIQVGVKAFRQRLAEVEEA